MQREARLRPEHAQLYPGVEPNRWECARVLSDKVLACRLLMPSGGFVLNERALHAEHFEFRGGEGPRVVVPDRLALDPRATAADSALT
jgi:hypothetical protein